MLFDSDDFSYSGHDEQISSPAEGFSRLLLAVRVPAFEFGKLIPGVFILAAA
jgi:hypothetical protein